MLRNQRSPSPECAKEIANRMLEAMQTIAVAGKLPPASTQPDTVTSRVIDLDRDGNA